MNNVKIRETNTIIVTIALFLGTFLSAVESTIVTTAMPTIVGQLHGVSLMNWVFSIYLLTSSIATPIYGKLSDQIGRKRILMSGLTIFILGSLLSGLANSMLTLIIYRAIQGIGAGVILPIAYTIIADLYPFYKRSKVIGLNGAGWGIAAVLAPLMGGFIVDNFSWRYVFLFNVPVGLIVLLMIWISFHEAPNRKKVSIDYLGTIYLTIILLAIMFIIQLIGDQNIALDKVAFLFVIIFMSTILFIRREHAFNDPIIPMNMFKQRSFVAQNVITFLISGFVMGMEVYVPNWIQGLLGQKASIAGLAITPSSIFWLLGSFLSGWLITKIKIRAVTTFGIIFVLAGSASLAFAPQALGLQWFFIIASISGLGIGITMTNTTIMVQQLVHDQNIGAATSFNVLCRTVGQTLFITIFGIFMSTSLRVGTLQVSGTSVKMVNRLMNPLTAETLPDKLVPHLKTILFNAIHDVLLVGLGLVVLALLISLINREFKKDEG